MLKARKENIMSDSLSTLITSARASFAIPLHKVAHLLLHGDAACIECRKVKARYEKAREGTTDAVAVYLPMIVATARSQYSFAGFREGKVFAETNATTVFIRVFTRREALGEIQFSYEELRGLSPRQVVALVSQRVRDQIAGYVEY